MSQIEIILLILSALFVLIGILVLFHRFSRFSLRAKLLTIFLAVALVPITSLIVINNFSTRNALTAAANASLSVIASQSADQIDNFIFDNIEALEKEAELDIFKSALTIPPEDFQFIEGDVLQAMRVLVERNPDSLRTYALLNREGNYITGHPFQSRNLPPFLGLNPTLVNGLQIALVANLPYVSPVILNQETGEASLYIATRISSDEGEILGLFLAVHDASIFQRIIQESNNAAGPGSFGIILDEYNIHLAHGTSPSAIFKSVNPLNENLVKQLQSANRLFDLPVEQLSINYPALAAGLKNSRNEPFFPVDPGPGIERRSQVATQRLESRPWVIAYIQPQETFLTSANQQTQFYILLGILFAALTILAAFGAARLFGGPITELSEVVDQISSGNLEIQAPVRTEDEIGTLATAFNKMTSQLKNLLEGLEVQVRERTKELERRAVQIQTAAEVARDANQIQDLHVLLEHAANLISQRFGFYHVGIFLLDDSGGYAVLRAANSEGGKQMLARGHRLKVGEVGIVGDTTYTGKPHIALDVDEDVSHFAHAFLPETRSEMALPLTVGDEIIGALDVQSKIANAFDQEDIRILQVLADQLAIAIQNSRLLSEVQDTLQELQAAYGDYTRRSWNEWSKRKEIEGYRFYGNQVSPIENPPEEVYQSWQSQSPVKISTDGGSSFAVPIQIRGNTLGVIHLHFDAPNVPDDIADLVDDLGERLALALDNAQLFEATQKRAAQEQIIGEITGRIRETLDIKTVLRTAVHEIRDALELHDIAVQLEIPMQDNI